MRNSNRISPRFKPGFRMRALLSLAAFVFAWAGPLFADENEAARSVLPLWIVDSQRDSILTVNNALNEPYVAKISLYDAAGKLVGGGELLLKPREYRRVRASQFVKDSTSGQPLRGTVVVDHPGHPFDLGLQLQVVHRATLAAFDVPPVESPHYKSELLRTTAQSPRFNRLVLSNSGDQTAEVDVTVRRGKEIRTHSRLTLRPNETRFFSLPEPNVPTEGFLDLVEVKTAGSGPGGVSGGVLWKEKGRRVYGYDALEDPARRRSPRLTSAGLYGVGLGSIRQQLSLQNTTDEELTVTGTLSSIGRDGDRKSRTLVYRFGPFEGGTFDLSDLCDSMGETGGPVVDATLDLFWTGPVDGLVGICRSFDRSRNVAVRNPLVDPETARKKVSRYVVRVGTEYRTKIEIKNPTDRPRDVIGHLFVADGTPYDIGQMTLDPGEVRVVDLSALQRNQTPDAFGARLPVKDFEGQFVWFPLSSPYQLIGRAVIKRNDGFLASSFSCVSCGIFVVSSFSLTFTTPSTAGEFLPITGKLRFVDCGNGSEELFTNCEADYYTTSDPSVATVNHAGVVTTHSAGSAEIRGFKQLEREICNLSDCSVIIFAIVRLVGRETVVVEAPWSKLVLARAYIPFPVGLPAFFSNASPTLFLVGLGDDRSCSNSSAGRYRTEQAVVMTEAGIHGTPQQSSSPSVLHAWDPNTGRVGGHVVTTANSTDDFITPTAVVQGNKVTLTLRGSAGTTAGLFAFPPIPESLSPAIDWCFELEAERVENEVRYTLTGSHDNYPAYEVWMGNEQIYCWEPSSNDLFLLAGDCDAISVNKSGTCTVN